MQKHVNLVDLVKSFPTNIYLQNLASIQKRTSPVKFAQLAEKSETGSISNLSTKVDAAAQKVADAAYGSTAVAEEAAVMNEDLKTSGNNALTQIDDEKTDAMGAVNNNAENVMEGMDKMWGNVESVEDTMKSGLSSSVDRVSSKDTNE